MCRQGVYGKSVSSPQFCCELTTALKIKKFTKMYKKKRVNFCYVKKIEKKLSILGNYHKYEKYDILSI